jgi:MYXO-CTERM domain-containing protein
MKPPAPRAHAALLAAALAVPTQAMAQCGDAQADGGDVLIEGTLRDVIPADQGTGVPIDTPIRLRYFRAVPSPPTVCVTRNGPTTPCLPGEATVSGDEIVWHPAAGALDRSQRYYVSYNETGSGMATVSFVTGSGRAPGELFFSGVTDVKSSPVTDDGCDPGASDITVEFDRATSGVGAAGVTPWPEIDIEYAIYQTRGPGISGARLRDRVRLQRSGSTVVREAQRAFRLTGAEADGPVCFNIQALDPLGRPDGNSYEKCVNPARGNYFVGCAATPASGRGGWWALAALALLVTRRRAR